MLHIIYWIFSNIKKIFRALMSYVNAYITSIYFVSINIYQHSMNLKKYCSMCYSTAMLAASLELIA